MTVLNRCVMHRVSGTCVLLRLSLSLSLYNALCPIAIKRTRSASTKARRSAASKCRGRREGAELLLLLAHQTTAGWRGRAAAT